MAKQDKARANPFMNLTLKELAVCIRGALPNMSQQLNFYIEGFENEDNDYDNRCTSAGFFLHLVRGYRWKDKISDLIKVELTNRIRDKMPKRLRRKLLTFDELFSK